MAVIFDSIMEGVRWWPEEEAQRLIYVVSMYSHSGVEPNLEELSPMVAGTFVMLKPSLDASNKRAESGSKGGQKRAENARSKADAKQTAKQTSSKAQAKSKQTSSKVQANAKQTSSKPQANGQANLKQSPSEEEEEEELKKPNADALGKERRRRFRKPTAREVDDYIAEMGYRGFTGQQLVDHYEANGWMRGKTPIRDWKACVRTWANRRHGAPRGQPATSQVDFSAYALREEE